MVNSQKFCSNPPFGIAETAKYDAPRVEYHFDITIINSTVQQLAYTYPETYIAVACGDGIQKIDDISKEYKTTWNKTFHFTFEAGKADNDTNFIVSLYQKNGEEVVLLGQTIEDLSRIDRDTDITKEFPESESSITFRVGNARASHMFALIVGIDQYQAEQIPNLAGCVNDAKDMEDFLMNDLNVPSSNVRILHNEAATRQNILLNIITHLLKNPNIEYGDAMVIFFAGHGNRVDTPAGWISSDCMIETICPHDESALDENGDPIPGIPDRTINELIRKLAEAKGNNIALIFDSCHSGGASRGDDADYTRRSFPNPCPINSNVDIAILGPSLRGAHQVLPSGFRYEDMGSHVLLAACKPSQTAGESVVGKNTRGRFSSKFIPQLRESFRLSSPMSYLQLTNLASLGRSQTPQCLGENKDCLVFTLGAPIKSKLHFKLKSTDKGFAVGLGSMHGVVVGTEFLIVHGAQRDRLGILVADKVYSKRAILISSTDSPEFPVPNDAEASIWNWNNLSLILNVFTDSEEVKNYISSATSLHGGHNLRLMEDISNAHVSISLNEDKKFDIQRLPGFLSDHSDIKGESRGITDDLSSILSAICHFRYHLQRTNMTKSEMQVGTSLSTDAPVKMHLLRLQEFLYLESTNSKDLFDTQHNATLSDEDTKHSYGIKITNDFTSDLFVYLFYFDPADYSIQEWYHPPSHTMDPPLEHQRSVTIGYGANGGDPFCFNLDEGQKDGTGFLKLFVSTSYADMSYLVQESPFTSRQPHRAHEPRKKIKDMTGSLVAKITVLSQ